MGKKAANKERGWAAKDRLKPLKVYVNNEDRAAIETRAKAAGLSISDYLRTAGLNHQIRAQFDHQAVVELCQLHGDLGRVGGLLKLWLAERRGEAIGATDIDEAYRDMRALQDRLRTKIEALP